MFFLILFGCGIASALLLYALKAKARLWRRLAACAAGGSRGTARATRFPEQVLLFGGGFAFQTYGPLTAGIHEDGLSLVLLAPFSMFCEPLFLPYGQLRVRRTDWHLNAPSYAMTLAGVEGIDIILTDRLWEWIRSNCDLREGTTEAAGTERLPG